MHLSTFLFYFSEFNPNKRRKARTLDFGPHRPIRRLRAVHIADDKDDSDIDIQTNMDDTLVLTDDENRFTKFEDNNVDQPGKDSKQVPAIIKPKLAHLYEPLVPHAKQLDDKPSFRKAMQINAIPLCYACILLKV